jgi:hypothetical protein
VGAVVDPFAGCGDPLAGGDRRGMADDGHQIAVAARFRPENAKAVLGVVGGARSTRPASTSWIDGSRLDFIRIAGSSVLSLGATSMDAPRVYHRGGTTAGWRSMLNEN